ncbi:phenylalanine--tRNA ligase subunit beta [Thermanaerovibrio acidaminovorans]|uniref:phenylalanine--tRNA ligase subunit beta n=1 Tax=Thermanaerovibrio acidaminovorans TaxID=81462 RepID=UPI00249313C7|nr:phenylalanine--tRNA ligase subunit beta [Thermanaerovibrio acidaminovorans]
MKVHLGWLKELLSLEVSLDRLMDRLTMTGTEVEEVISPAGASAGILVAKVLSVEPHPSRESLRIARVFDGENQAQVVTGASNVEEGHLYPYAPPGARIWDGTQLGSRAFDGVESQGMLLSCEELGLEGLDSSGGLLKLPEDVPVGADFISWAGLHLPVLDLSVTPNRGDLCSMLGVAREVKALLGGELLPIEIPSPTDVLEDWSDRFSLRVDDPGCWKYLLGYAEGVRICESPFHSRLRLVLAGMRPVNNVVDATNLAMLLFGHPLHAFDADRLNAPSIEVRPAREGEVIRTLDGRDRALQPEDLLICSGGEPVAIAGVMGGEDSEVRSETTRILLESAVFDPARVSLTSRRLGIPSQAAFRYSRAVDWAESRRAAQYALALMASDGVRVGAGFISHREDFSIDRVVKLRTSSLRRVLLMDSLEEATEVLERLGFQACSNEAGETAFKVPSWRSDVEAEEDLVEEVGRVRGYEAVKPRIPGALRGRGIIPQDLERWQEIRRVAISRGYVEVMTYSFTSPEELHPLGIDPSQCPAIVNPISRDQVIMRPLILPGLIRGLRSNLNFGWKRPVRLFEWGTVFPAKDREAQHMAGLVYVGKDRRSVHGPRAEEDFFTLKGDVEALLSSCGFQVRWERGEETFGHRGQTASVMVDGRKVGFLCRLKPSIESQLGVEEGAYGFEVDLSALEGWRLPRFGGSVRFPSVSRDVAIMVEAHVQSDQVRRDIESLVDRSLAEGVELFDVYAGKGIPEGLKSLAFSVVYRHPDRTLRDEEVDHVHNALRSALAERGYKLR